MSTCFFFISLCAKENGCQHIFVCGVFLFRFFLKLFYLHTRNCFSFRMYFAVSVCYADCCLLKAVSDIIQFELINLLYVEVKQKTVIVQH